MSMSTTTGTNGNDTLVGESAGDTLIGGDGNDELRGGAGNDWLDGGKGVDDLYGEDGNDTLVGGFGRDRIDGGSGTDVLWLYGRSTDFVVSFNGKSWTVRDTNFEDGNESVDQTLNVERIYFAADQQWFLMVPNNAPVSGGDRALTLDEDSAPVSLGLAPPSDADGDELNIRVTALPTAVIGSVLHANGIALQIGETISVSQLQGLLYAPVSDAHDQDAGQLVLTITDAVGAAVTQTVTFAVAAVNDAPVAEADTLHVQEDQVLVLAAASLLVNDSDADVGDSITVVSVGSAQHGHVHHDGTTITYTPFADFSGTDTFTYTVSDGSGALSSAVVTVNVLGVNDAPRPLDDELQVAEDGALLVETAALLANDLDPDTEDRLTLVSAVGVQHGTLVLQGNMLHYTPHADFSGSDRFQYEVQDTSGSRATAWVTVLVTAVNDAPVAEDDRVQMQEDAPLLIRLATLVVNDSDADAGEQLSVAAVQQPLHGSVQFDGNQLIYTPHANFEGLDTFEYVLQDAAGLTSTARVYVDVLGVNDAPQAVDDHLEVTEDVAVSIAATDLLLNDTDPDMNDVLSVVRVAGSEHGAVHLVGDAIVYTPDANYAGSDTFSYEVVDGAGVRSTGRVTVTVAAVNDAPQANDDPFEVDEDGELVLPAIALLHNDSDPDDSDTQALSAIGGAHHGQVTIVSGESVIYRPNRDFNGTDRFIYEMVDASGAVSQATVHVTVRPVNDAPTAGAHHAQTLEDTVLVMSSVSLLARGSDPDGDALVLVAASGAQHGQVEVRDGQLIYTPDADYAGTDAFTYTVQDTAGLTGTALVSVTVTPVNDAPRPGDDMVHATEDTPLRIDLVTLQANDGHPDGEVSTAVVGVGTAAHGQVVLAADGSVIYTPDADFAGGDAFIYTVVDQYGQEASATVNVQVAGVNDAPVASHDVVSTLEDTPLRLSVASLLANDSDADPSDGTSLVAHGAAAHGSVLLRGSDLVYTPHRDFSGSDVFTYTIRDAAGATSTATVSVDVGAVNDAPFIVPSSTVIGLAKSVLTKGSPAPLAAAGTLRFTDAEAHDTHTVAARLATARTAPERVLSQEAQDALASGVVASLRQDSTAQQNGEVRWVFRVPSAALDFLALDEVLDLSYEVTVTDSSGASRTETVGVRLLGSIGSDRFHLAGLQESRGAGEGELVHVRTGTFDLSVAEVAEDFTPQVHAQTVRYTDAYGTQLLLTPEQEAQVRAGLSFEPHGPASEASLDWSYSVQDVALNFLAEGASIRLETQLRVPRADGGSESASVVLLLLGSNDRPVLLSDPAPLAFTEDTSTGSAAPMEATGSLEFSDVDWNDPHVASTILRSATWSAGRSLPVNVQHLIDALSATVTAAPTGSGRLDWSFALANRYADFLDEGETLTLQYDIVLADGFRDQVTKPLTVTITGTNDTPVVQQHSQLTATVAKYEGTTGNDTPHKVLGGIILRDEDLQDVHTLAVRPHSENYLGHFDSQLVSDTTGLGLGTVKWTFELPDVDMDSMAPGSEVVQSYDLLLQDAQGNTSIETVEVTLKGPRLPGVAQDIPFRLRTNLLGEGVSGIQVENDSLYLSISGRPSLFLGLDAGGGPFHVYAGADVGLEYVLGFGLKGGMNFQGGSIDVDYGVRANERLSVLDEVINEKPFINLGGWTHGSTSMSTTGLDMENSSIHLDLAGEIGADLVVAPRVGANVRFDTPWGSWGDEYEFPLPPYRLPLIEHNEMRQELIHVDGADAIKTWSFPYGSLLLKLPGAIETSTTTVEGAVQASLVPLASSPAPVPMMDLQSAAGELAATTLQAMENANVPFEQLQLDLQAADSQGATTGLGQLRTFGVSSPFSVFSFDITKAVVSFFGFPPEVIQGNFSFDFGDLFGASLDYTTLQVLFNTYAALSQETIFTPEVAGVSMQTSFGEVLHGELGDDFAFETPEGEGTFDVSATYSMVGTVQTRFGIYLTAALEYTFLKLSAEAHYDINLFGFGASGQFAFDMPALAHGTVGIGGGLNIPLWTMPEERHSLPSTSREYTLSYEKFYVGTPDEDTFTFTTHQVSARGLASRDVLTGNTLDNDIDGGQGDDQLDGRDGDDLLAGGAGADILLGGSGSDTAGHAGAMDGVLADLAQPAANSGDAEGDVYDSIENLAGSAFDDILRGDGGSNRLEGAAGDDLLQGRAGPDLLRGGAGSDTAAYADAPEAVLADLQEVARNTGDAAGDAYDSIENLQGSAWDDELAGDGGDNELSGGLGEDVLLGRDGSDTASYAAATAPVVADLSQPGLNTGEAEGDFYEEIENLRGSRWDDVLRGDATRNILTGGLGADLLEGGDGQDAASYVHGAEAVAADLETGTGSAGEAAGDRFAGIEDLIGSAYGDVLAGDAANNVLTGGAGDDVLHGREGTDTVVYSGGRSDYRISRLSDDSFRVEDRRSDAPDGVDLVHEVEFFRFTDGLNSTPVVFATSITVSEDDVLDDFLAAGDREGDSLRFYVDGASLEGLTVREDGSFLFDPRDLYDSLAEGESATVSFAYRANDGSLDSTAAWVTLNIVGANDAPQAADDVFTGAENTLQRLDVLANDADVDRQSALSVVQATVAAGSGTAWIEDNQVLFDPGADFDYLATGNMAYVLVEYEIRDEQGATAKAQATVAVTGLNDAPVALADVASGWENASLTVNVLANDSDVDTGDTLSLASVGVAGHGSVAIVGGALVYTPYAHYSGSDAFSYTVRDAEGATSSAAVEVWLEARNAAPVATATVVSLPATLEDHWTHGIIGRDVATVFADPDGDTLAGVAITGNATTASQGVWQYSTDGGLNVWLSVPTTLSAADAVVLAADAHVRFLPARDFNGQAPSLTVRLIDSSGGPLITGSRVDLGTAGNAYGVTDVAVTQTFAPQNDAPSATLDGPYIIVGVPGAPVTGNLLANDNDVDGDALVVSSAFIDTTYVSYGPTRTVAAGGTLVGYAGTFTVAANGTFSYDTARGTEFLRSIGEGSQSAEFYSYTVSDGQGGSSTNRVWFNFRGVNDVPQLLNAAGQIIVLPSLVVGELTEMITPSGNLTSTGSLRFLDPDTFDTHVVSVTSGSGTLGTLTASVATEPSGANSGRIAWAYNVAAASVEYLAAGQTKRETFTLTLADRQGGTTQQQVEVVVHGTADNATPVGGDDVYFALPGELLTVTAAAGVLANDRDPEADALQAQLVAGPAFGSVALNVDGSFSYAAHSGYTGTDAFSYAPSDGNSSGPAVTVRIIVEAASSTGPLRVLTSAAETVAGGAEDTQVRGTSLTLNAADRIDMGAGFDELMLYGTGEFNLQSLASISGIDRVRLINDAGGAAVTLRSGMNAQVVGGDGAETYFASPFEFVSGAGVHAGGGADSMYAQNLTVRAGAVLDMGDGNDFFAAGLAFVVEGLIDGGAGTDTLELYNTQADLTDASHIRNFETFALDKGTYQIDQAIVNSQAVVRGRFGGTADLVTGDGTLDLRGWSLSGSFTYGSVNASGTTFTVGDAATGIRIRGGAGQDTVVGQGLAFTETQKFVILSSGVETVVDVAGTHTLGAGAGVLLTPAGDTLVGGAEDTQVRGTSLTLNAGDRIDMGAGFDELMLYGTGEFNLQSLASISGIDRVRLVNDAGGAAVTLRSGMNAQVFGGDGAETYFASPFEFVSGAGVHAGGGADSMYAQNLTVRAGAVVDMGDGNDYFAGGPIFVVEGLIDGGAGTDTLELYNTQADLTDASHIRNFETFALDKGTYQIDQAIINSQAVVRGRFGGTADLVTGDGTLDLRGWSLSGSFTYGSVNASGTTFTVGDAATGIKIRGGAGQDTVVGQGLAFSETQKFVMLSSGVETVVDMAGTHTLGADAGVLLTPAGDTLVGGAEDSQVRGTSSTLNAADRIDMGAGFDELMLYGTGEFNLQSLASISGIDRVRLINDAGGAAVTLRSGMNAQVVGGDGAETYFASPFEFLSGAGVHAGGGADSMYTQNLTVRAGAVVDMGDGNDMFMAGLTLVMQGLLDGGAGGDTLELYESQADLTDVDHIRNFETFALGKGTYQIDQAIINSQAVVRGRFGGEAHLVIGDGTLDLRGWSLSGSFTYGSVNASGTTFTVDDAATGIRIRGGTGDDLVVAEGFAFTAIELTVLGDAGIERVIDTNGLHIF
jgi:VCBS repeat-containing protein